MRVGTKSLLFGAHQVILHPLAVIIAWVKLYHKLPNWREIICIIIHDWGYWGCYTMDGDDGYMHPVWAATKAVGWFGKDYYGLCMGHSRHLANKYNIPVSKLYAADKLSFKYIPWWVYVPMALATGEIWEYRKATEDAGLTIVGTPHKIWHRIIEAGMIRLATNPASVPYLHHKTKEGDVDDTQVRMSR